jgi:hypothetical protein
MSFFSCSCRRVAEGWLTHPPSYHIFWISSWWCKQYFFLETLDHKRTRAHAHRPINYVLPLLFSTICLSFLKRVVVVEEWLTHPPSSHIMDLFSMQTVFSQAHRRIRYHQKYKHGWQWPTTTTVYPVLNHRNHWTPVHCWRQPIRIIWSPHVYWVVCSIEDNSEHRLIWRISSSSNGHCNSLWWSHSRESLASMWLLKGRDARSHGEGRCNTERKTRHRSPIAVIDWAVAWRCFRCFKFIINYNMTWFNHLWAFYCSSLNERHRTCIYCISSLRIVFTYFSSTCNKSEMVIGRTTESSTNT